MPIQPMSITDAIELQVVRQFLLNYGYILVYFSLSSVCACLGSNNSDEVLDLPNGSESRFLCWTACF